MPDPRLAIVPYDRARHGDAPWRIVSAVFEEYGFPFAENDYDADLLDPSTHYDGQHGWFAIAEVDGEPVGCVGLTDEGEGLFELHRLYVLAGARRFGAGSALVGWVFDTARARGARRIELFSDIAFEDAHRLYRSFGFRNHRFRYAPDPWQSREWGFTVDLDERLAPRLIDKHRSSIDNCPVTAKEALLSVVEDLSEEEAERVLGLVENELGCDEFNQEQIPAILEGDAEIARGEYIDGEELKAKYGL